MTKEEIIQEFNETYPNNVLIKRLKQMSIDDKEIAMMIRILETVCKRCYGKLYCECKKSHFEISER